MKKIIAGVGLAALALVATGFAQAATIGTVSGGSSATAKARFSLHWGVTSTNSAAIGNTVGAEAISGGNTLSSTYDQNGTTVNTGNSGSTVVVDNSANSNDVTVAAAVPGGSADAIGLVEGGSTAYAKFKVYDHVSVDSTNAIMNENTIGSSSLTGGNNILSGGALNDTSLTTGTNGAQAGLTNAFNVNVKSITRTIVMP